MKRLSTITGGEAAHPGRSGESLRLVPRAGIERAERIAYWLDDLIRIPFTNLRIGLDPLLGLVPWAGDMAAALFSLYLIGSAIHYRLPKVVIARMALNVGLDYLIGLVPFVGDTSDFFLKANKWNLNLLRRHAEGTKKPGLGDYLFVGLVIALVLALMVGGIGLTYFLLRAGLHSAGSVGR